MSVSMKPYLLRGLYEWSMDAGLTPHIAVWVNEYTQVPLQYVKDEQIVLNISGSACQGFVIDDEWIRFSARFAGQSEEIFVPIGHVVSFFARETGEGMGFELTPFEPDMDKAIASIKTDEAPEKAKAEKPSHLKLVK